ncbi:MAG TPA: hypothetical protein DEA55_12070 [Rhodospirillaceae bacterium]|nr:hypothetical protein [Rhodospirillaceae bacterium]
MRFYNFLKRFHAGAAIGLLAAAAGMINVGNPRRPAFFLEMLADLSIAEWVAKTYIHLRIIIISR